MKTAKRFFSIILAMIMAFSFASVAFAADGENGEIDKTCTFDLKKGETKTFSFTADKDGFYLVYTDIDESSSETVIMEIESEDYYSHGSAFQFDSNDFKRMTLKANDEFTIKFTNSDKETDSYKVEFTVKFMEPAPLAVGENRVENSVQYFSFTPEKDGLYNFRSSAAGKVDPDITVYGRALVYDFNDDSGYEDDYNFDLTLPLKAGETYTVEIKCYADSGFEPFNVTISYNKEIKIEELIALRDIDVLYTKVHYGFGMYIVPSGAAYSDEITVTVGNEKILSAEADGDNLSITPHRIGKTTITVSTASGITQSSEIWVLPYFFRAIANWFIDIEMFFARIFSFLG